MDAENVLLPPTLRQDAWTLINLLALSTHSRIMSCESVYIFLGHPVYKITKGMKYRGSWKEHINRIDDFRLPKSTSNDIINPEEKQKWENPRN